MGESIGHKRQPLDGHFHQLARFLDKTSQSDTTWRKMEAFNAPSRTMPTTLWSRLTRWIKPQPASPSTPSRSDRTSPQMAKQLRATHREQLFSAVRETMIRAGILSGAYKFKALTLDKSGTVFIVMFDFQSPDWAGQAEQLGQLEVNLQALTQTRLGITVKAVYWRHAPAQPDTTKATPNQNLAFAKTRPMLRHPEEAYPHPLSDTQLGQLEP